MSMNEERARRLREPEKDRDRETGRDSKKNDRRDRERNKGEDEKGRGRDDRKGDRENRDNRDRVRKRRDGSPPPRNRARFRGREGQRVDRQKICPLLLRVFCKLGEHHHAEDFKDLNKEPTEDEFQIYTWKDATLGELTSLIKGVRKAARRRTARLSFAFVYPDRSGKKVVRVVGQTFATRRSDDGHKSLADLHFETGDYLDVAIFLK
ncbi:hypothetical protein AAMO2058_000522000 [Amorphochlora amoebiformis]|eukprot:1361110-Amorphochlora_amoeboformis.AAC.1